jgi:hypothetical protein
MRDRLLNTLILVALLAVVSGVGLFLYFLEGAFK